VPLEPWMIEKIRRREEEEKRRRDVNRPRVQIPIPEIPLIREHESGDERSDSCIVDFVLK